jgi:hypothetical protein
MLSPLGGLDELALLLQGACREAGEGEPVEQVVDRR